MSTIGLKGIFEDALKKDGYQTSLFESFREKISSHPSPDAFLSSCLLFGGRIGDDALPALSSLLPNWIISYDLTATIPALKRHVSGFKLEHRYNGTLDVPLFDYSDTANGTKGIRSMTQTDDLSPLIGLNITMPFGLTLKEHYNRRRSLTMMMSSLRLLEQQDFEVSSLLSYSKNFPALFRLPFPLFEDADHRVTGTLTHLFTRSYLLTRMIETGQTSATQGLDSHRLQISLDYSFSRALTIRGFYELTRRRPLVSLYDYPFRRQTYGILFLFTLR